MPANALAAVALGAGFALNAGLLATERGRISLHTEATSLESVQFSSGVDGEALAGLAAIALGIPSALEAATSLMLVAVLVLGIGAICTSGILIRLYDVSAARTSGPLWKTARDPVLSFTATSQRLVGIVAIGMAIAGVIGPGAGLYAGVAMILLAATSIFGSIAVLTHLRGLPTTA